MQMNTTVGPLVSINITEETLVMSLSADHDKSIVALSIFHLYANLTTAMTIYLFLKGAKLISKIFPALDKVFHSK